MKCKCKSAHFNSLTTPYGQNLKILTEGSPVVYVHRTVYMKFLCIKQKIEALYSLSVYFHFRVYTYSTCIFKTPDNFVNTKSNSFSTTREHVSLCRSSSTFANAGMKIFKMSAISRRFPVF